MSGTAGEHTALTGGVDDEPAVQPLTRLEPDDGSVPPVINARHHNRHGLDEQVVVPVWTAASSRTAYSRSTRRSPASTRRARTISEPGGSPPV